MDINDVIENMTLQEKAALCTGASAWTTTPIERLDVPEMIVSDGPHGVRREQKIYEWSGGGTLAATCFPTASCLASTWDVDLLALMGEALAKECIALNVDVLLGPGVNIKRSPLGGRNFEYFSEDPYLAGELAASLINAIQNKGVGTSLKHYVANNQEFQRFSISAEIDERTLREVYLLAFEKAVKQAQPWTVMCAYNKVNGTLASQHDELLNGILKDEWGFEGLVVSDWGAVRDRVAALKGGLDWQMPGPQERDVQNVIAAVESGELDAAILDESVRRILQIVAKASKTPKVGTFDIDAHHGLARQIAAEGMVLLKNTGILPLKNHQKIAVIGRAAMHAHFQGGGSSHITPTKVSVPFEELKVQGVDSEFTYAEGYPVDDTFQQGMIDEAVTIAQAADVALLYIALPSFKESEGYDRPDMDLTQQQIALIQAVATVQPNTVVVLNNGAPITMSTWIHDVAAVLEGWMMGQAGGAAIADILFGKVNPSAKLSETFPMKLEDVPSHINWPGELGTVRYGEGLFVGYRYYDVKALPVQFPFGHGLSYTSFVYSNPMVSSNTFKDIDGITVSIDITNTGEMAGKEIVQVYVCDHQSSLVRPEKELKGFAKVSLQPGETKTVSIDLDFRAFAYYHPRYADWITEDGAFDILIAASANDIRQRVTVTLESTMVLPCILDKESTMREWMADPRGRAVFRSYYDTIEADTRERFGGNNGDNARYATDGALGMDVMDMLNEMPIISVLLKDTWKAHPEDIVTELLAKVHNAENDKDATS